MSKTSARSPAAIQNGARGETSESEFMIRRDLEMEIEKGLEKEIKDDIYRLALQLLRLYQNQEGRNINNGRALAPKKKQKQKTKKKARGAFSEVNISIKMDRGAAIVEIKETKEQNLACKMPPQETKRLDWARTLRSGAPPVVAIRPIAKKKTPPFVV